MRDLKMIINDFFNDNNLFNIIYAMEYGAEENIDGYLYYHYEGIFTDEEKDVLIDKINNRIYNFTDDERKNYIDRYNEEYEG